MGDPASSGGEQHQSALDQFIGRGFRFGIGASWREWGTVRPEQAENQIIAERLPNDQNEQIRSGDRRCGRTAERFHQGGQMLAELGDARDDVGLSALLGR
jgi:hypothetical protein